MLSLSVDDILNASRKNCSNLIASHCTSYRVHRIDFRGPYTLLDLLCPKPNLDLELLKAK